MVRLKRSWRARRHSFPSHSSTGLRSSMNTFSDNCFCMCTKAGQSTEKRKSRHQELIKQVKLNAKKELMTDCRNKKGLSSSPCTASYKYTEEM